jgi:hypothetical protein
MGSWLESTNAKGVGLVEWISPILARPRSGAELPSCNSLREVRVFYDVFGTTVEVLAIVAKPEAELWLAQFADPE